MVRTEEGYKEAIVNSMLLQTSAVCKSNEARKAKLSTFIEAHNTPFHAREAECAKIALERVGTEKDVK